MSAISLVVLVRVDPRSPVSDLERFLALGLRSLQRFAKQGTFEHCYLVVPAKDVAIARRRLRESDASWFRVVNEDDVVAGLRASQHGWIRQQVLKLGLSRLVTTPWCLVLDADIVATRPIDEDFLLPGGRAIWRPEEAQAHMGWWKASAGLLDSDVQFAPEDLVFGVTPAMLHVPTLASLHDRIEELHPGRTWSQHLLEVALDTPWTEYTLYWTHVADRGLRNELYSPDATYLYPEDGGVWSAEQITTRAKADKLSEVFRPEANSAFFVFQSTTGLPLHRTVRILRPFIEPDRAITPSERARWSWRRATHAAMRVVRSVRWHVRRLRARTRRPRG